MKKFLFALLFAGAAMGTQAQTLVKTFDTAESSSVKFNFKNKAIKTEYAADVAGVRVELEIKANMPQQIMDELVKAGRYSLEGSKDGEMFVVNAPNLEKAVSIRGTDLQEEISLIVKSNDKYLVDAGVLQKDLGMLAARDKDGTKTKEMKKFKSNVEYTVRVISTLKTQPAPTKLQRGDILIGGEPIDFE